MEASEIVQALTRFLNRGAGTDAERRAAAWLANEVARDGQEAAVETFWCRPNWALAHAFHAAFAIAGGLLSLASPVAGITILAVTLGSVLVDSLTCQSLGRWITRERASQNVLVASTLDAMRDEKPVRLIVTANYDAGRAGLLYRDRLSRPAARVRQVLRSLVPGWLGWLSIAIAWLLAIAIVRLEGHTSQAIGAAQLPPTVALLIGFALLVELGFARWSPAAGDNASGVAVAAALTRALETIPPQHLEVELLLTGAGDGNQIGVRRYLQSRRHERTASNTVVLGFAPCAAGQPCWWFSDGPLIPLRYAEALRVLARQIAADEPHLQARPHRGRGTTPALPARALGIPAITIGCLDRHGLAPHSHQRTDVTSNIDRGALDRAVQFGLMMVDGIDAAVGELRAKPTATPA
jgi:hypothetical protein